jgi:hypothetical protein
MRLNIPGRRASLHHRSDAAAAGSLAGLRGGRGGASGEATVVRYAAPAAIAVASVAARCMLEDISPVTVLLDRSERRDDIRRVQSIKFRLPIHGPGASQRPQGQ